MRLPKDSIYWQVVFFLLSFVTAGLLMALYAR